MNNVTAKMDFDVLIIGAGLVGTTLACALENLINRQGLRLAIVEAHDFNQPRDIPPSFDARVSALSWGSFCIYDQLGLWSELDDQSEAINTVHISDKGGFGISRLKSSDVGIEALGYVVNNYDLGRVLLNRVRNIQKHRLVEIFSPDVVDNLRPVPGGMQIKLSKKEVTASLVVLADGGRSALMNQLGITQKVLDYHQQAIIANVAIDRAHNGYAWERFDSRSTIALLPLGSDDHFSYRMGLVWTLADDEADTIYDLPNKDFLALLQDRFGYRAGRFLAVGTRDRYPLSTRIAKEQIRPGLVVLGNAAHTIHPVAAQGYNLSVRDTLALMENIEGSLERGITVGSLARLQEYEIRQYRDQQLTSRFCDGLVHLFARTDIVSFLSRNLALNVFDCSLSIKSKFILKAMGM